MTDGKDGERRGVISQRGVVYRLCEYVNEIVNCGMLVNVSPTAARAALQAVLAECSGKIIEDARKGRSAHEIEALAFPSATASASDVFGEAAAYGTAEDTDDETTLN